MRDSLDAERDEGEPEREEGACVGKMFVRGLQDLTGWRRGTLSWESGLSARGDGDLTVPRVLCLANAVGEARRAVWNDEHDVVSPLQGLVGPSGGKSGIESAGSLTLRLGSLDARCGARSGDRRRVEPPSRRWRRPNLPRGGLVALL